MSKRSKREIKQVDQGDHVGLLSMLLLVFVMATGLMGYWLYVQDRSTKVLEAELSSERSENAKLNLDREHLALEALLRQSGDELEKADLLELNLLVAKEIPGCEKLDIKAFGDQVDDWSRQVKEVLDADPNGFERDREKWKTLGRFKMAVMGSVLKEDLKLAYVDKLDNAKPEHKFVHGILQDHVGSCATLPVIWTVVGRRLGLPLKLAQAPEHLYCIYDDGQDRFNVEATGNSHLGMTSDEGMQKMCKPEWVKNGTCLRPLSNRESLGVFLQIRAEVWLARHKMDKALSDLQRAHELLPKSDLVWGMLSQVVEDITNRGPAKRIAAEQRRQGATEPSMPLANRRSRTEGDANRNGWQSPVVDTTGRLIINGN